MAIPKNLEALLAVMSPEDAKAQRAIWEGNAAVAEQVDKFFVPQSEFSRQLNLKDVEIRKARDSEQSMRDWEKRERPKAEKAYADVVRLEQEAVDLRAKADRIATNRGDIDDTTVDPKKIVENVMEQLAGRTVSQEKMTELMQAEAVKLSDQIKTTLAEERKNFFEQTVPQGLAWQADMMEVMYDHQNEFGKKLDRAAFSTFMQENKMVNPKEAYERFAAPTRQENTIKAEVDRRVNSELAKRNVPGVSSGESGEPNWLQLKVAGEKGPVEYAPNSELGDRSTAMAAAKELREEGHF